MAPKLLDRTQNSQQNEEEQQSTNNDQPEGNIPFLLLEALTARCSDIGNLLHHCQQSLIQCEKNSLEIASLLKKNEEADALISSLLKREKRADEQMDVLAERDGILRWTIRLFKTCAAGSVLKSHPFYSGENHKIYAEISVNINGFLSVLLTVVEWPASTESLEHHYAGISVEMFRLNDDPLRRVLKLGPADNEENFLLSPEQDTVRIEKFIKLEELYEQFLFEEGELSIMIKLIPK